MAQSVHYSRRKLLCDIGLGSAGVALASWTAPLAAAGNSDPLGNAVSKAQSAAQQSGLGAWSALVGQTFTVLNGTASVSVTLVSMTTLPSSGTRPAGLRASAISAVFEGQDGPAFPAGNATYTFRQPDGSAFQLFVGRKSVNGATARLVAIFN